MERLEGLVDRNAQQIGNHETRIQLLERSTATMQAKLDKIVTRVETPPRWLMPLMVGALLVKDLLWPIVLAALGR